MSNRRDPRWPILKRCCANCEHFDSHYTTGVAPDRGDCFWGGGGRAVGNYHWWHKCRHWAGVPNWPAARLVWVAGLVGVGAGMLLMQLLGG